MKTLLCLLALSAAALGQMLPQMPSTPVSLISSTGSSFQGTQYEQIPFIHPFIEGCFFHNGDTLRCLPALPEINQFGVWWMWVFPGDGTLHIGFGPTTAFGGYWTPANGGPTVRLW